MSKRKTSLATPNVEKQVSQVPPVAILTITYLPPLNQIANLQAVYPAQIDAQAALHILRRAEEMLIGQIAQAQAKQDIVKTDESK